MLDKEDVFVGSIPSTWGISTIADETEYVTDYVANGSFESLAKNVTYKTKKDYAILIRLTDFNNDFKGDFVFVDKQAYDFLRKSKLHGGEIIISNVGAYAGTVFYAPKLGIPMTLGPNSIMMNFKSGNAFYYYWLKSPMGRFLLDGIISGSAQPKFNKTMFRQIKVPVPPPNELKAIASVLTGLDDKINLLNKQNATLENLAITIFRKWFVIPIKKGIEEGVISDGFSKGKFDNWISGTVGGEWGKDNLEGEFIKAVKCIRGTDIAGLNTGIPTKTPLRFVKESKFQSIEPKEGDLILEISGGTENQSTGRICYINEDVKKLFTYPLVFSNFCRMLRVKRFEYSYFLYCYIQYLYNQDEFFNLENGSSGIKNLDYKALLFEIEYPMPSEELVIEFHKIVGPLFKKVNQNKTQILTISDLRDTLLPKLMSGEAIIN